MSFGELITYINCALLFLVVFGLIEYIKRKFGAQTEIMRRVAHISAGLMVVLYHTLLSPLLFGILVTSGGIVFYILSKFNLLTSINNVTRHTYGQYVLTLGYLAAFLISLNKPDTFVPTILILTFADALAGLYGTIVKANSRTITGSILFFVIASAVLLATGTAILPALAIAFALTIVERVTPLGLDNLSIPVASALLLLAF